MSAADVWKCVKIYRTATSSEIYTAYGYSEGLITRTLEDYDGKDAYHGHTSGKPGDAENPSATTNLNLAIAFLRKHAPKREDQPQSTRKKQNTALKNANIRKADALIEQINAADNLGALCSRLNIAEPNWKNMREVWQAYRTKYYAKNGVFPKN